MFAPAREADFRDGAAVLSGHRQSNVSPQASARAFGRDLATFYIGFM